MPKAKAAYPEIEDIKEDLHSLKNNVVDLTNQIKKDGLKQTGNIKSTALDQIDTLKETTEDQMKKIEARVKHKPAQSLAAAFAVGFVASMLFGRR